MPSSAFSPETHDATFVKESCSERGLRNIEVVDDEAVARLTLMEEERLELVSQLSTCPAERVKTDGTVE